MRHQELVHGLRGTVAFFSELCGILAAPVAADPDPGSGVEAIADFFRADETIFEVCDDSDGNIGAVFCRDALELFVGFVSRCNDEARVIDVVVDLNQRDGYCVRYCLIKHAADYLSESGRRDLILRL